VVVWWFCSGGVKLLPSLCEIKLHSGEVVVRVRYAGSRDGAARCCSRLVVAGVAETLQVCEGRRCVVVLWLMMVARR